MLLRLFLLVTIVVLCGCSQCHSACGREAHGGLEPPEGIHPLDVR
jgi:hypothetical protein